MHNIRTVIVAIAVVAFLAIATFGVFRGEFKEIWYNGATL